MINLLKYIRNYVIPTFNPAYAYPPGVIYLAVNSKCNMKCRMCDVGSGVSDTHFYKNMITGEELQFDVIKKLIDDIRFSFSHKPMIAITSVEPLLYKSLWKVIKYTKDKGFNVQLTTNGYKLLQYAYDIVSNDVDELWVSIDGPRNVHDAVRGINGVYDAALNGIKSVVSMRNERGRGGPRIYINYTVNDLNYDKLIDFMLNFPNGLVDGVYFSHLNFVTPSMVREYAAREENTYFVTPSSVENVDLDTIDAYRLFNNIQFVKRNFSDVYFIPDINFNEISKYYSSPLEFIPPYTPCKAPWRAGQIFSNGDVGVATRCFNIAFGNIKHERFSEIWNGKSMVEFRNRLLNEKNGSFSVCSRCCGVF